MKVLLWEMGTFFELVLWDGENTYWSEEMIPSGGYTKLGYINKLINSRFTYIGEL
jgi:hypothetical protein